MTTIYSSKLAPLGTSSVVCRCQSAELCRFLLGHHVCGFACGCGSIIILKQEWSVVNKDRSSVLVVVDPSSSCIKSGPLSTRIASVLVAGIHHLYQERSVVSQIDRRMPVQPSSRGAQSSPVVNETSVVVAQHCPAVFVACACSSSFLFQS